MDEFYESHRHCDRFVATGQELASPYWNKTTDLAYRMFAKILDWAWRLVFYEAPTNTPFWVCWIALLLVYILDCLVNDLMWLIRFPMWVRIAIWIAIGVSVPMVYPVTIGHGVGKFLGFKMVKMGGDARNA